MYIRRDYSQPLFSSRRRKRRSGRLILILIALIIGTGVFVSTQFDQLQTMAMKAMGISPTATAMPFELANEALVYYAAGELETAAKNFEQALAQRPEDISYIYEYGLILIAMGEYERAIELGDQAIQLNQFDPRGYTLKGRALVWADDAAAAIPVLLAGQAVDGQFSPLYSVLARAYIAIGNFSAGLENAELAVEFDPMNADARRSYAYALNNVAAYDQAIEQLEIAVATDPQNIDILMELAGYYLWNDRDDEAIDIYTSILAFQPRNARAMLRLCDAYRKIGEFEIALGHCEDAAITDPDYTQAQFRYGLLQYSERNFDVAKTYFERCVESDPDNLDCYYRMGLADFYLSQAARDALALTDDTEQQQSLQNDSNTYCDSSWDVLQKSLLMAQSRDNTDELLENIRLGLSLVSRECPAYRGAIPGVAPVPTSAPQS